MVSSYSYSNASDFAPRYGPGSSVGSSDAAAMTGGRASVTANHGSLIGLSSQHSTIASQHQNADSKNFCLCIDLSTLEILITHTIAILCIFMRNVSPTITKKRALFWRSWFRVDTGIELLPAEGLFKSSKNHLVGSFMTFFLFFWLK
jgi:hypothetical protein